MHKMWVQEKFFSDFFHIPQHAMPKTSTRSSVMWNIYCSTEDGVRTKLFLDRSLVKQLAKTCYPGPWEHGEFFWNFISMAQEFEMIRGNGSHTAAYIPLHIPPIEGILPKGPHRPCASMAGRAPLAGYPRYAWISWDNHMRSIICYHCSSAT